MRPRIVTIAVTSGPAYISAMPGTAITRLLELRRSKRAAMLMAAAFLLYAVFGFFVVPWIIKNQIRSQARTRLHREARVDGVAFNPFTLTATVSGLHLSDQDGTSLLAFDRFQADLQLSGFLRRALRFRTIHLDHPVLNARILANGRPSVADLLESGSDAQSAGRQDRPFQLPRLIVDRLVVNGGLIQFSDSSRQPVYQSRLEPLTLDIHNLITIPEEGGQHSITIGVDDGAVLRWTGQQTVEPLRLAGTLDVRGLNLRRVWDYFGRGQPLDVADGRIDVTIPYEIRRGSDQIIHMSLNGLSAAVRSLTVRPHDQSVDWLSVPELRIENVNATWPEAHLDVASVRVVRPHALALVEKDGVLNWTKVLKSREAEATGPRWEFRIASLDLENGAADFADENAQPPVKMNVSDLMLHAGAITGDGTAAIPVTIQARVLENGTISASGSITPAPMRADVTVNANGVDIGWMRPYAKIGSGVRIGAGSADLQGQLRLAANNAVELTGSGALNGVELQDPQGDRLLAWRRLQLDGLSFNSPPDRARIRRITLDQPFAKILIDRSGRLNLAEWASVNSPGATAANQKSPMKVEIGVVEMKDGSAEFQDESLLLPFRAEIHSAAGTVRDLSSFASAPATVSLEGRVDQTGYVQAGGTLRLSNPLASSELTVGFRSIEMLGLTPYFAQFAGYAVKSGVLDLDVRYVVKDRRLIGDHRLTARDLVVGERVKDSSAPGLPVRLAVALLKDREGRINMDVPIQGTVDSPEFDYRKVFWTAVRTILGNAAKAPFRAIGRLFGRDDNDLELVEFDPGRSDLLPAEQATLTRLAEQIGPRRELTLSVEGRFDPVADQAALKQSKLEKLIESRRDAASAAASASGDSTLETILEALFVEQFSSDALQSERVRFGSAPAAPCASGQSGAAAFDAAGFYEALRARLLEAQTITDSDLAGLANARAQTIAGALTASGAIESGRVIVTAPSPVKRKKAGSSRIASEMTITAEGDSGDRN